MHDMKKMVNEKLQKLSKCSWEASRGFYDQQIMCAGVTRGSEVCMHQCIIQSKQLNGSGP